MLKTRQQKARISNKFKIRTTKRNGKINMADKNRQCRQKKWRRGV